ncbi:tRNA:m(4)X modification enzyme TRM13 homolog [Styela clava]|uniref:tRNA:m(4)X modification enzyme TRM13 homolog n=1 Tax=Styela clava TaxID=7725 RepID=UPI00193AB18F|nr:tRNA:m(4)X modification enzyme TRM13 homolog [Styela clava]
MLTNINQCESNLSCKHYLTNKKRNCRLERVKGKEFCVQHIINTEISNETDDGGNRIRCPLDPSHTCDKKNLSKHMRKCNAKKLIPTDAWYVPDINCDPSENKDGIVEYLRDVSISECKSLIDKLKKLELDDPILHENEHPIHNAFAVDIKDMENSVSALRQIRQNANLLGLMERQGLLVSPGCYIEFGAGRGQFSISVIKTIPIEKQSLCLFVLVDRGTNRRKLDAKHRQSGDKMMIKRIRSDIKDLCISNIEDLPSHPLVAISKHLCGVATDFALKCIVRTSPKSKFHGGVIALCCHHRVIWDQYCGKEYFKHLGLSARDFSIISLMSSWAVCHFKPSTSTNPVPNNVNKLDFLSNEEKTKVGLICKNVIDRGRVSYMIQNGYDCVLIEYTEKSVSLENVALVFSKK